jgi:hypothetical protein
MTDEIAEEPAKNSEEVLEPVSPEEKVSEEPSKELEEKNKQLFERAKKAEAEVKAYKAEIEKLNKSHSPDKSLDVEDYIDISASLEGLDQKEKERLAREHKLTGRPLSEIRKDEDFALWQSAYRAKVEKEKTLNPSTRPSEVQREKSFPEKLEELDDIDIRKSIRDLAAKEKLLEEKGFWKNPKQSIHPKIDLGRG